jgi:hypothetical protein
VARLTRRSEVQDHEHLREGGLAGGITAAVAGALMVALSAYGGGLAASIPAIVGLTVPLVVAGVIYGRLVESGRVRAGFGPGILYWSVALAAARLAQEFMLGAFGEEWGLSEGVLPFLTYQFMVGGAFGLGIVMIHGQIALLVHRLSPNENDRTRND